MSSRALSLATVLLLIDFVAVDSASAQAQNLEAGKSPSQLFAQTCSACHKSPRGLLKTVPASSLSGFLRQHYTTSPEMAGVLSSYLVSNGATDARYGGGQAKGGKDAGSGAAQSGTPDRRHRSSQEVSKPDSEQAAKPDAEAGQGRAGQRAKRGARSSETPEAAKPQEEQAPAEATNEHGSDGRKHSRKHKHSKPVAEEPANGEAKDAAPAVDEKSKSESTKSQPAPSESAKGEAAKVDPGKDEGKAESIKPAAESKPVRSEPAQAEPGQSESAKAASAKEGANEAPAAAKPASAAGNRAEPAATASEPSASTPAVPSTSK